MKITRIELDNQTGRFSVEFSVNGYVLEICGFVNLMQANMQNLEEHVLDCMRTVITSLESKEVQIYRPEPTIPMPLDGKFYEWDENIQSWIKITP